MKKANQVRAEKIEKEKERVTNYVDRNVPEQESEVI